MRIVHLYSGNLYGGIERALVAFAAAEHAGSSKAAEHAGSSKAAEYAEHADRPAQLFALAFDGRLQRELEAGGAAVVRLGEVRGRAPWTIWRARRRLAERLKPLNTRKTQDTRNTQRGHPGASAGSAYSAYSAAEGSASSAAAIAHSLWALAVLGPAAREAGALVALYLHNPPSAALWPDGWARRTPVDLVVANSRYTAAASRAFLPDSVAIECLHPPLLGAGQASGVSPADRQTIRARVRRELETPDRDAVIVQASRMEAWKGHAALIGALAAMRELPGWTAWIVGGAQRVREQAYVNGLHATVRDAGLASRVRFAGDREDVGALLAAADIYCQPNRDPEPFGLAFVEALGAGLPVVTTAAGGALEIVTGDCGRLVPAGDTAALTAALRTLVGDAALRASLGAQGPARARALCHPGTQLERLTAILSRAAAMRPRTTRMHAGDRRMSGVSARCADAALDARARQSRGDSSDAIRALAVRALDLRGARGVIVDVGCGSGRLRAALGDRAARYVGVDAVRHDGFPAGAELVAADLDRDPIPLPDGAADAAVALETIEHLENPRQLVRELARVVRPGGVVVVSTPNQRSLLSLLTLVTKGRFNAFQDADYPAHRTALLEIDLVRIAAEAGLTNIDTQFTGRGRIPLSRAHYPRWLTTWFPRALSDNILLAATRCRT